MNMIVVKELSNNFLYSSAIPRSEAVFVGCLSTSPLSCSYSFIHALSITEASGGPDSETH